MWRDRHAVFTVVLLGWLTSRGDAGAQTPTSGERFVRAAREVLGTPYRFGGRLDEKRPGIDCQGVLFYAAERVGECGWKSYSVIPTLSVKAGELGRAVPGLDPVRSDALDISKLQVGDVLLLVGYEQNPVESAIATLDRASRLGLAHRRLLGSREVDRRRSFRRSRGRDRFAHVPARPPRLRGRVRDAYERRTEATAMLEGAENAFRRWIGPLR